MIHSHSHPKMQNWTSSGSLPKDTPMTWLKANFKPPPGKEPVVVDLLGMGVKWQKHWPKNCGNPSERWYHVPRSFLNVNGDSTLILFEKVGGDPSNVTFQVEAVGNICANAYEGRNWN
ncbi:hypothetical protein Patl1_13638 [Pistacia atlantica]|uniref:Uncharacterized protein n=1 Tax=Pistacia atlantica TaxID=434234 RepID=A0ACC1ATD1_9ROSI|nr:hypothetical protein Patl1_13638 [Pistacia atlantica]